ncbi:hypothetical protein PPYR_07520 [Photinus pyralis]|uniref:Pseudouridine synthase I TruA alpha/beta domain-containing protein n=1 Tax=Photinus pyralis TaxID=7054 RepID=A0A5N4AQN6_PHOPY|nr:hypothetical protein PPYR_07520 [Photinus pyralis]
MLQSWYHVYLFQDLIDKIIALQCHNVELKNIIAKSQQRNQKRSYPPQKPFDFTRCKFRHVLLQVLYLGWDYQGYACQEDSLNTIEHFLFEALLKTCLIKDRQSSNYHRCGRTDKGVSAFGQVISLDLRSNNHDLDREINYCIILNKVLPPAIRCVAWCPVSDNFSARFNCTLRKYKYFFPKGFLNIQKMVEGTQFLVGSHDFRNFCKMDVGNGVVKYNRTITHVDILPYSLNKENEEYSMFVLVIQGQAFLWHQIRCIMGVLLLIGQEKEDPSIVKDLLDVEKHSRKPDYNMASDIPLNLYDCEYELESNWRYDDNNLTDLIKKLQSFWTFHAIKANMVESMLLDLRKRSGSTVDLSLCQSNYLLNGVRAKKYVPLVQRQKCESLENRIQHFIKRRKLEGSNSSPVVDT